MAARTHLPAWIRRRISDRPVARWIAWDAGRRHAAEAKAPAPQPAAEPSGRENVVFLFRRSA